MHPYGNDPDEGTRHARLLNGLTLLGLTRRSPRYSHS